MRRVRFSDVVKRVNVFVDQHNTDLLYYVGGEHMDSCELKVSGKGLINGSTIGYKFHFGFQPGHILFGSRNPHLRKCSMVDFSGICSDSTYVVETRDSNALDQRYLLIEMQSNRFWDWAEENKSGSVNYLINYCTLDEYEFDLPPIERQRELANLLWAANDLKESYKKAITATDEMLKAKFREMFGAVEHVKLAEIAAMWLKGQPFRKDEMVCGGKTLCIHYGELFTKYGPIISDVVSTTNADIVKKSRRGDILFPASDVTPNGLTKCSALMIDDVLLGGDIIVLRPKKGIVPEYLSFAICSEPDQMLKCVTGGLIKHISAKAIKGVTIPLPPLSLQREFVAIAERADAAKSALKQSIADIDQVMKGLING